MRTSSVAVTSSRSRLRSIVRMLRARTEPSPGGFGDALVGPGVGRVSRSLDNPAFCWVNAGSQMRCVRLGKTRLERHRFPCACLSRVNPIHITITGDRGRRHPLLSMRASAQCPERGRRPALTGANDRKKPRPTMGLLQTNQTQRDGKIRQDCISDISSSLRSAISLPTAFRSILAASSSGKSSSSSSLMWCFTISPKTRILAS
jgi:hypothetical protein